MPDTIVIAQFERRLVELGCPARPLAEKVRELAEHHEDLKQAALEEGLSENEAAARADVQLGDPIGLAENTAAFLRRSSWWGRHPVLGFCVLPLLAFMPVWMGWGSLLVGICWLVGKLCGPAYALNENMASSLSDDPTAFYSCAQPLNLGLTLATLLFIVAFFCGLARRAAVGLKWTLVACLFASVNVLFTYSGIYPHDLVFRVWWLPAHWYYLGVPAVFAALLFFDQRRKEKRLAWVPMEPCAKRAVRVEMPPSRAFYRVPTYWVVTVLTLALSVLIAGAIAQASSGKMRRAEVKAKVWPAERAATLAQLQKRQSTLIPPGEEIINLLPYQNATLTDSIGHIASNSLAALPVGVHTFGGISFDIEGRVQLAGGDLPGVENKFPRHVSIPLAGKYARIHLLHGAVNLSTLGNRVALVVLHYADGSMAAFPIIGGAQVLDWWGPIYNTDSGIGRYTTSPDTELAWAGGNPAIQSHAPNFSLRLYRTTFTNPHSEREIMSIDYIPVSTPASHDVPAPFLVGLTVDRIP